MQAFDTLSRSRQVGMSSPQPLQLREMLAYLELVGIHERQQRLRYVRILQTLDDVYLAHVLESTKAATPKA